MPRLCAFLLLAGVALAALPRRRPTAVAVLPDLPEEHLALLRMPCSPTVH